MTTSHQIKILTSCILISIFSFLVIFSCDLTKKDPAQNELQEEELEVGPETVAVESCNCESDWFPHSQTPAPEEGKGSPFDTSSTINCIFHQWSWQKFLWLTKPQPNGNPLFLNETILVDAAMAVVEPQLGLNLVLSSFEQAGGGGILKSTPGYNPDNTISETVYYSIHMDSTMFAASEAFKTGLINGEIPATNTESFPVNSLELKIAWVDVNSIPSSELDNYFTSPAAIKQADGSFVNTTVALLGMHVVGVVINHPEFIWATFEHSDMGPLYDWNNETVSSDTDNLLFAKGSASGLEGIQWNGSTKEPDLADEAFTLFEFGIPRELGHTFMTTSQSEPMNYNNIISINSCVAKNLDDVFNKYYYKGSLWINTDGLTPQEQADTINALGYSIASVKPGDIPRGCVSNSNLSMETFEQTFAADISSIDVSNIANCFSCHNAVGHGSDSPKSPLYISHVFDGYLSASQGKTMDEIDTHKLKQYLDIRQMVGSE